MSSQFAYIKQAVSKRLHNRHFWQAGGLLMLANAIVLALGLIRTPAMTWLLPKEQVGMIGVVASWLPFVQLLSLSGLDTASYHFVAKGKPWALVVNISRRLRWSLVSTAVLLAGAAYWWWQGDGLLAGMFVVAGLSYPVTIGLTAAGGMLGAQENFKGLFWYRLGESLTDFAGFIPLLASVWWVSQVVTFYAANQIATAVMMMGLTWWLVRQLKRNGERPLPPEESREIIRYGKHLTAISSISVIQSRADAFFIGLYFPLTTMADYSIALLVYNQIKSLWGIYTSIRYPPVVRLPIPRRQKWLLYEGSIIFLGFVVLGLIIAWLGHWLIPLLLPAAYITSLGYMDWLIASIVVMIPGGFVELYFRMAQDEKQQYYIRSFSAVVAVAAPLLLYFLSDWGAYSIVIGRFIASAFFSLLAVWRVRQVWQ